MRKIKIKRNECPINAIANDPERFNDKIVKVEKEMMEKLINEAREADEKNVKVKDCLCGESDVTGYEVTIPGEIETKLFFIKKMTHWGRGVAHDYYLAEVKADDIKGCKLYPCFQDEGKELLNEEKGEYYRVGVVKFEYEKEAVLEEKKEGKGKDK